MWSKLLIFMNIPDQFLAFFTDLLCFFGRQWNVFQSVNSIPDLVIDWHQDVALPADAGEHGVSSELNFAETWSITNTMLGPNNIYRFTSSPHLIASKTPSRDDEKKSCTVTLCLLGIFFRYLGGFYQQTAKKDVTFTLTTILDSIQSWASAASWSSAITSIQPRPTSPPPPSSAPGPS